MIVACFPSSSLSQGRAIKTQLPTQLQHPLGPWLKIKHPVWVEGIPESFSKICEVKIILPIVPIDFFLSLSLSGHHGLQEW